MLEIKVSEDGAVMISGELTLANVDELHTQLRHIINEMDCSVIDCTGVTEISTPALQVITAFRVSLASMNREVKVLASPAIKEAIERTGLELLLMSA